MSLCRTTLFSALLAIAPLALCASAQSEVQVRGQVDKGEAATGCYYCPGWEYVIKHANVPISSSSISLAPLIGQYIQGTGTWVVVNGVNTVQLSSISIAPESFSIGGSATVGNKMDFTAHGTPGDTAILGAALNKGFLPLLASNSVLFLDLSSTVMLGAQVLGSDGQGTFKIKEVDASLAGVTVYGQALMLPQNGAAPFFTNLDRKLVTL